jgi:Domain of unknown function (DUF4034)
MQGKTQTGSGAIGARWWGGVLRGTLVAGALALSLSGCDRIARRLRSRAPAVSSAQVAQARERRTRPLMIVAPAPLPSALPVVERVGTDADGYPKSYVDAPALRSLLHYGRFQDLTAYVEQLQSAFEADPKKELWPSQAADAFASADPALRPQLDAWCEATPNSFAPSLALGAHWTSVEGARRGSKWARETPAQDFKAMHEAAGIARLNLAVALSKRPRLVAAQRYLIKMALLDGRSDLLEQALTDAVGTCPGCFGVRVSYLYSLLPRWGGSYQAMVKLARSAPTNANSKLSLLKGYVDLDKSDVALTAHRLDAALEFANAAGKPLPVIWGSAKPAPTSKRSHPRQRQPAASTRVEGAVG